MKKTIFSGVQPTGNLHLGNYLGAISQWVDMQDEYEPIFCVVDYHAITVPQDSKGFKQRIIDVAKTYLAAGIDPVKATIFVQSDIKEHAELAWILNCTSARMSDLENMTQYKDKTYTGTEDTIINKKNIEDFENFIDEKLYKLEKETKKEELVDFFLEIKNKVTRNFEMDFEHFVKFTDYINSNYRKNLGVGLFDYPVLMAADILLYNTDIVPVGHDQLQHIELARDLAKR